MAISKLDQAQSSYVNEIRRVQENAEKWKDFLDFSASSQISENMSEYEFSTKLIIHAYNPNAKDCRTFGEWKTEDGNHVKFREKGIPVLSRDERGNQTVTHLFDTSQTALNKEPQRAEIPEEIKKNLKLALDETVERFSAITAFSEEQKRLFKATAEYKLCKQYGIETSEDSEIFSGIEKLSVREVANIGIALNKCSRSFSEIVKNERSNYNERNNDIESRDDRTELHGRESRGMDLGGGVQGTRQEVRVRRKSEPLVQAERGERDLRTADRDTRTEADSGNGQVRQSAAEIHMADTVPDRSGNDERGNGRSEALRGDERKSSEPDRRDSKKEETVTGVQGTGNVGEISSESADVGGLQDTSGGGNTSRDGLRNITSETAEPEKGSVVSDLSEEQPDPFANAERSKNGDIILGNTKFRYIPDKTYIKVGKDIAANVAEQLEKQGIKFSGVIKGDTATITVSKPQKETLDKIIADISSPDNNIAWNAEDIVVGDKFLYKGNEVTVSSLYGIKPDDISIVKHTVANGMAFNIPKFVNKYNLAENGVYLGNPENENERTEEAAVYTDKAVREAENQTAHDGLEVSQDNDTVQDNTEHHAEAPEFTDKEKAFLSGDIEPFMAKAVLSWDEIEDLGYPLYEKGYSERFTPSQKAIYGNGMSETKLYDIADRMHNGDDIRKELALSLLGNQHTFTTTKDNIFSVEYGEDFITAKYGNAERQISYEDMGNAFLNLIESEHNDIVHDRTVEDLQYVLHDLSDESAENLLTAFDNAAKPDWENSRQEQQQIKSALYDILGDEEQAEKAFESIAKYKYNYEPKKENRLEFHFGNGKDVDWISESDIVRDFALANPDCSFALGNAVFEYLDEKQHTERNIPELKAGWYKKTNFEITATVGGEDFHYEGRFDIGDGKGTGGGSLIDHIRDFNQGIMDYSHYPYNTPEAKEQAKNTLEILVPFLEKNSVLTEKEKEILEEFKAANPIRSYEDIEKKTALDNRENIGDTVAEKHEFIKEKELMQEKPEIQAITFLGNSSDFDKIIALTYNDSFGTTVVDGNTLTVVINDNADVKDVRRLVETAQDNGVYLNVPSSKMLEVRFGNDFMQEPHKATVADLSIGDVILYEGKRRKIEELSEKSISMRDLDSPDSGGILLSSNDVLAYKGWQEDMNRQGFEIISKAQPELTLNVGDVIRLAPDKENPEELPERYGVVESVSDYRIEIGTYSLNDTAFCLKSGAMNYDKKTFAEKCDFELVGNVDELRAKDYEQNKEIYEALANHNIIRLTEPEKEQSEEYPVENARSRKFNNLRIEFNEIENDELDKGFVLKADTDRAKDLILVCYGELSPENMYHSIKSDNYSVSGIEKKQEQLHEKAEIPDKISFEVFGGGSFYFRDEKMNNLAEISSDGIKYYAELSENDKKKVAERAKELTAMGKNNDVRTTEFEPDPEGKQLSLFNDSVPLMAKENPKQENEKFAEGLFVGNVNRYAALHDEIMQGTGFQNGKFSVKQFYDEKKPANKEFADFLKNAYGTGGHSGDGEISFVDHDSKGMFFTLDSGEKFKFTWSEIAEMTAEIINKGEYITQADIDQRIHSEQTEPKKSTPEVTQEQATVIQPKEKNMSKISETEEPIHDDLLNALLDNRNDIPSGKSMDFNGNGYQITYADRARMLEAELKNNKISIPEAINVMQLIGFQFDNDKITFERPDTTKIHNAFDKFRENHSELSDNTRKFLERAEVIMANRFMENFQDVVSSNVVTFSYGKPDKINEDIFDGKLDEVTKEINGYINGNEHITVTHPERTESAMITAQMLDKFVEQPEQQEVRQSVDTERVTVTNSEKMLSPIEEPKKKSDYFRITDEHLGEGSKREKFQNNVEAIKTLKRLEDEERPATPEEQETLSKYIGWGGLQEAFDKNDSAWSKEYFELKNLLSEDEYEAALATVKDAFYTSPVITNAIYEGLENIGFKGGEVLEPSMGVGNFFGTMPDSMRENSNLSGVEIDSISGRIAQKLYPEASIAINGFEKVKPSKGAFDLAVGNVPFGTHGVNDKTKAYKGLLIHDYFFAKSLDSVRPGGVVAFITSTGTLDKEDTKVRQMLAQKAELMGAVRLPNNAFQKNAGTPTTTDIIFLKKREKPLNIGDMAADKSCDWVHTKENNDGFKINSYFADNPEMVLGELSDKGRFGSIICTPIQGTNLKEQLHEAMKNIKGEYIPLEFQQELDERAEDKYLKATPDIENLTYTVVENKLYFRVDDNLIPLKESEQHGVIADRRKAMCDLGETTRELLKAQVEDRPDKEIKLLQAELNTKYDFFVKKFGRINPIETPSKTNANGVSRKAPNSNVFKNDVRLPLLQSLERMKEGQFIGKAEIFTERTIRPRQVAEHVDTAQEALILSMSEKGKIDFGYMQDLTGFEKNKLIDDLHGDIYPVPELSTADSTVYQTADEYLSGNIYKKIAQAESRVAENPAYAENIAALTEVIPKPLKATEIDMQLGMTWIDPKIIQQFMYEKFDTPQHFREYDESIPQKNPNAITVEYSGAGKGTWRIENASRDNSIKSTKNFGTKDYNAYELLEKILNSKSVAVTQIVKDDEGKQKTIILEKQTRAAEDKVKLINAEFKKWIFANPERRNELVKTYNEKFNCIRPREYDGSNLNFFGSNPEITLKPHQKNAVAHALFGGNTLFAHQVGAGKTFEMIATAMEGKRLGLHNKSMFVVPNHLTEQIGSDFMKLYPNANILVAKPDDFSPQKRRQMCARIATGNFDAVIIGHSQLIKIPLSPKREEEFIRNQINEVISSLEAAKDTDSKSYTVKQLEATKAKLRERLDKLTNSTVKDNAVTFEELGVDKLFVDEAHEFKNLYVSTKMENVSGLSTNADVQKTQDLYLKCQYLDEITGSKGIVFSTGTPVTNALSEMFTTMKYLQSDLLKETGLDSFDSWAGNFTRKSTDLEISPSGSEWKMKTRLKFTNVPELVTMFKECADIKMADQLTLDVPECSKNIVSVEPTEIQKRVVQSLGERAEKISKGEVSRTQDNMLVVTGDGRKLGLDQRLFDLNLPDEPQSKLNACVNNVHDIWASTADRKSTQLIFCDLGVPQSKEDLKKNGERFDVYTDIRKKLIDKGIPEKEIAFIHEANSETEKAKLFAKVRSGDVRVLIGSTQKMGAGTNVQNKLIALHDLDCPWRPADLTQRLGRMVRQGNENDRVHNFRYVTKGTFDAYLYQMVEKKQESIAQIFTSKAIARTCDDIDDMAVDFMQVKMAAVGDDRIRRQMELREDIRSLNMLRNTYLENKYELQDNINELPKKIEKAEKTVEGIAADVKMIESYKPSLDIDGKEVFQMKVGGEVINGKKEAAEAFTSAMTRAIAKNPQQPTEIAEYKGFKIAVSYDTFSRVHRGTLKGAVDYPFELGNSESGNITRIDNVIASVPKRTDVVCNDIERMKIELADSIREVNEPFEHEAELAEKKQELDRLTEEINADKVKGKIAPEQPESTAEQPVENKARPKKSDSLSENVSNTSENIQSEPTVNTSDELEKQEQPDNLNIKWKQNGKELRISYDSTADNKVTSYVDGKENGHCTPEEFVVSSISESEKKHYPLEITNCVKPLNLAFSDKMAMHIKDFAEKVKNSCKQLSSRETSMFSREKIMTDDFKPTSEKSSEKSSQQHI